MSSRERLRVACSPIVLMLAAAVFINYVDRGVMPAAADLMQRELQLSPKQLGILLSAFFWTYACAMIPSGWLAEQFGARRLLALGLTVWALATVLVGVTSGFVTLLVLRLLLGVGESVAFPSLSKLLADGVPAEDLGTANGIIAFAYLIGPAVGTLLGGYLMSVYGWRSAFLVFGLVPLLWLWPWLRMRVPHRPRAAVAVNAPSFGMILRERAMWGTGLGLFSTNYTFYFMLSWLPYILVRVQGFSTVEMGKLVSAAYLLNAVSALVAGWVIDRVGQSGSLSYAYKTVMVAAHVGAVACMLGMGLGSRSMALVCLFIYQALCGAQSPGVFAVSQILAGPKAAGRWVGIQNTMGSLAGIAPAVTGFIVDSTGQFTGAFIVASAVSLLGVVGWVVMLPRIAELSWDSERSPALSSAS